MDPLNAEMDPVNLPRGPVEPAKPSLLLWGVAAATLAGEAQSGDQYLVRESPDRALVAVVDGLGHGAEAAAAAYLALEAIARHETAPLPIMVRRCHEALIGSRGVVLSVAKFNLAEETMSWIAVGNVEGFLQRIGGGAGRRNERLMLRGGVVGYELPVLRPTTLPIVPGDTLVLTTDGVRNDFAEAGDIRLPPQQLADQLLRRFARATDDALALVVRYRGPPP